MELVVKIFKKLTSPVLLLIHSIPPRDRSDNEHERPMNSKLVGSTSEKESPVATNQNI
jgi:hypothetical protein